MIKVNIEKARVIAHDMRRKARDAEFAPHDDAIGKQIPGKAEAAEAARAEIRARYADIQSAIDAAQTVDALKSALRE